MARCDVITAMATHVQGVRVLTIGLICTLLIACTPIMQKSGYVPETRDLDRLIVGTDTRETVSELIGRPSTTGLLNNVGWYYVESSWEQKGPAERVETDRKVVAITFDSAGKVENVEQFGLEQGQVIALSRRVTKENVASLGFLRRLFGNIGSVGAGQLIQ